MDTSAPCLCYGNRARLFHDVMANWRIDGRVNIDVKRYCRSSATTAATSAGGGGIYLGAVRRFCARKRTLNELWTALTPLPQGELPYQKGSAL